MRLDGIGQGRSIPTPSPSRTSRSGCCSRAAAIATPCSSPIRARQLSYHYERNPADPRVSHGLTLEVDDYGNVLKTATVVYPRRQPDPSLEAGDQAKQAQLRATSSESDVTNAVDEPDAWRTPLPCETRGYELTGLRARQWRGSFQLRSRAGRGKFGRSHRLRGHADTRRAAKAAARTGSLRYSGRRPQCRPAARPAAVAGAAVRRATGWRSRRGSWRRVYGAKVTTP